MRANVRRGEIHKVVARSPDLATSPTEGLQPRTPAGDLRSSRRRGLETRAEQRLRIWISRDPQGGGGLDRSAPGARGRGPIRGRSGRADPPVVREAAQVRNPHWTGSIERGSVACQRSRAAVWPADLGPSLPSSPRDLWRVPPAWSSNVSLVVHPARPGERLVRDRPGSARGCSYGRSRRVSWGLSPASTRSTTG